MLKQAMQDRALTEAREKLTKVKERRAQSNQEDILPGQMGLPGFGVEDKPQKGKFGPGKCSECGENKKIRPDGKCTDCASSGVSELPVYMANHRRQAQRDHYNKF